MKQPIQLFLLMLAFASSAKAGPITSGGQDAANFKSIAICRLAVEDRSYEIKIGQYIWSDSSDYVAGVSLRPAQESIRPPHQAATHIQSFKLFAPTSTSGKIQFSGLDFSVDVSDQRNQPDPGSQASFWADADVLIKTSDANHRLSGKGRCDFYGE